MNQIEKQFRMKYDIHTHTTFSHGKGSIEDNVKVALEKGLSMVGISDHGPGHATYGVKHKAFPLMRQEIERLKPLYPSIDIRLGVEANIIDPTGKLDITEKEKDLLDYVLAGYHYGIFGEHPLLATRIHVNNFLGIKSAKQRTENTELVIKALFENRIKVLTHPGDKGSFDLMAIAKACEQTGTMMEISTWHEAPTMEELRLLSSTSVHFIISSDAHTPGRVGTFVPGIERALAAGLDPARIDNLEEVSWSSSL